MRRQQNPSNSMKLIPILLIALTVIGCGSESAKAPAPEPDASKTVLSEKLKMMTPEERAKYVQEHPNEISDAYSGVNTPGQP